MTQRRRAAGLPSPGPKVEVSNRQNLVLLKSHPDCEACDSLRSKLNRVLVENGGWRWDVYELKRIMGKEAPDALLDYQRRRNAADGPLAGRAASDTAGRIVGSNDRYCIHGAPLWCECFRCEAETGGNDEQT